MNGSTINQHHHVLSPMIGFTSMVCGDIKLVNACIEFLVQLDLLKYLSSTTLHPYLVFFGKVVDLTLKEWLCSLTLVSRGECSLTLVSRGEFVVVVETKPVCSQFLHFIPAQSIRCHCWGRATH